jgi:hypothetical protein
VKGERHEAAHVIDAIEKTRHAEGPLQVATLARAGRAVP